MTRQLLLGLFCTFGTATIRADDWPQWRGSQRDAVVADFKAPATWPKELEKKWTTTIGEGVSTPALVKGKLYTFGYQGSKEVTRCLDAATGKEDWKDEFAAQAARGPASGFPAARGSPAVAEGKVVTFGVQGTLSCLDVTSGKVAWRKDSTGGVPGFATSCSPLLTEGLCIVQIGGDRGGSVVAYQLADGKEKWKYTCDGTKYSSPVLATIGDVKAVVVETAGTISAVGLADGKLLWSTSFSTRYNAAMPAVEGSTVYCVGSGVPTRAVKLEKDGEKLIGQELWKNNDGQVIYNTPVIKDGLMFGLSERNEIFGIDATSGKTLWTKGFPSAAGGGGGRGRGGYGSIVATGSVFFALTPAGQMVVFKPNKEKYEEVASYKVADGGTYAYPIVTSGGVYIRDKNAVSFLAFP